MKSSSWMTKLDSKLQVPSFQSWPHCTQKMQQQSFLSFGCHVLTCLSALKWWFLSSPHSSLSLCSLKKCLHVEPTLPSCCLSHKTCDQKHLLYSFNPAYVELKNRSGLLVPVEFVFLGMSFFCGLVQYYYTENRVLFKAESSKVTWCSLFFHLTSCFYLLCLCFSTANSGLLNILILLDLQHSIQERFSRTASGPSGWNWDHWCCAEHYLPVLLRNHKFGSMM